MLPSNCLLIVNKTFSLQEVIKNKSTFSFGNSYTMLLPFETGIHIKASNQTRRNIKSACVTYKILIPNDM